MLDFNVCKTFEKFKLDVSFKINADVTALFGRSGAGKSTILNLLAGLARPDSGYIKLDDHILFDEKSNIFVPAHTRGLGVIFQDARLFPHLDIKSNLTYSQWAGSRQARLNFDDVVDLLGINTLLDRKPENLSGGEKQRVAIGRALLSDPKLLLLDEPLASLDIERKRSLLPFLKSIRDEFRIPMILVSHDPMDVHQLAEQLVLIDDGNVVEAGSVRHVFASATMQELLGERNQSSIIQGEVSSYDEAYALTNVAINGDNREVFIKLHFDSETIEGPVKLLVHARDVALSLAEPQDTSLQNCLPIAIKGIKVSGGAHMLIECETNGQVLFSQITRKSFDELGLKLGNSGYALIKSVALA